MIIHIDHRPFHFMHTQGKLHNDYHEKWSMYLQKFHLNIKYNKENTIHVTDCLSQPLVMVITTVINSYGHETSKSLQLYNNEFVFAATYHTLSVGKQIILFNLQDVMICHLSHICAPSSSLQRLFRNFITVRWHDTLAWKN